MLCLTAEFLRLLPLFNLIYNQFAKPWLITAVHPYIFFTRVQLNVKINIVRNGRNGGIDTISQKLIPVRDFKASLALYDTILVHNGFGYFLPYGLFVFGHQVGAGCMLCPHFQYYNS